MEPIAYFNGRLLPYSEVRLPPYDAGFVQGTTVGEQLRTFGGRLFRLEQHLQRLSRSLGLIGVRPAALVGTLGEIARSITAYNHRLLTPGDDLGLSIFVTPGVYAAFSGGARGGPTVCINTYPLAFDSFADKYESGQSLVVTETRQVPAECWPPELKCRSRMHYFLADREARQRDPEARALLLDLDGHVTEASTANLVIYRRDEGLISPPREKILPGISVAELASLAAELSIPFLDRELSASDVATADEAYLTSTSPCVLPCTRLDGRPIGTGRPGPVFEQLISAWSTRVGVDIRRQAQQFATRHPHMATR